MVTRDEGLENRLTDWLNKQGYPLEMLVARLFQQKGFRVQQSEFYADQDTGESREIDVVASKSALVQGITIRVTLAIECKLSKDKPWILFTSQSIRLSEKARIVQRAASGLGSNLLRILLDYKDYKAISSLNIFDIPTFPCYSLTQAFTTSQDVCYKAATSVAKAAYAKATEFDYKEPHSGIINLNFAHIVLPILVVDGKLFDCHLEENSQISVFEINFGVLIWRNPLVKSPHTIIHVVSVPALGGFCDETAKSIDFILQLCKTDLEQQIAKIRERPPPTTRFF
jgi:Holliday junction resolvase-like predicted endonuclease